MLCQKTGQELALRTNGIGGVRSLKLERGRSGDELAGYVVTTVFF